MSRWAVLMVCLLGGCVPDRPARTPLDALLAETTCGAAVSDLLTDLGAAASYLRAPPAGDGSSSVRVPTARFAEWIAVTLPRDGAPVLSRVTPEAAEVFQFLSDCSHTSETTQSQAGEEDQARFTDEYLLGLLEGAGTAPLVVYVWSPHMPLSPDGWPEIQRAAQIAGMRATPALMAHSDREFAAREVARVGMPLEGLREIASVELIQRQAQVHAPSIIIFGRDRVSPVLPGYRNTQGYLRYLEAFLEES